MFKEERENAGQKKERENVLSKKVKRSPRKLSFVGDNLYLDLSHEIRSCERSRKLLIVRRFEYLSVAARHMPGDGKFVAASGAVNFWSSDGLSTSWRRGSISLLYLGRPWIGRRSDSSYSLHA
jgi:hypothetical protein